MDSQKRTKEAQEDGKRRSRVFTPEGVTRRSNKKVSSLLGLLPSYAGNDDVKGPWTWRQYI
jgi:hypothetical protein